MNNCPACNGLGFIQLTLRDLVPLENAPPYYTSRKKNYPCPECQQIFYKSDLMQCYGSAPLREHFKTDSKYIDRLKLEIAYRIGCVVLAENQISFKEKKEKEYSSFGFDILQGSVYIVKSNAQGWKNE